MKWLIFAGTYEQENDFSYSVLAGLRRKYKLDTQIPLTVVANNEIKKGQLWNSKKIALGVIGESIFQSMEDVYGLTETDRKSKFLDLVNVKKGLYSGKKNLDVYSWTNVHEQLFMESNADVYIDLRAPYYKALENVEGVSLFIDSFASPKYINKMGDAFFKAQRREPEIYGANNSSPLFLEAVKRRKELIQGYELENLDSFVSSNAQIDFLTKKLSEEDLSFAKKKIRLLKDEAAQKYNLSEIVQELLLNKGNGWQFTGNVGGYPNVKHDCFRFNALTYGADQVDATVCFINGYLIK